jgi:hypothetical protein
MKNKKIIIEYSSLEETIILHQTDKKYYIELIDEKNNLLTIPFLTLDEAMKCFHQLTDDSIDH